MKILFNNGIDCISIIIEYLTDKELCKLCLTTKEFQSFLPIKLKWKRYCLNKWNITEKKLKLEYIHNGMSLYPYIWPICSSFNIPQDNSIIYLPSSSSSSSSPSSDLSSSSDLNNYLQIEFNGLVGENNRSVRTKEHFPPLNEPISNINLLISFAKYLCGCKKTLTHNNNHNNNNNENDENENDGIRYFTTPYYDSLKNIYHIELRQVAYYEVTITSNYVSSLSEDDCIAIGLSKESFSLIKVMPGWDKDSYGYHSDDGGIFHGKGTQLETYGPKYGLNDIVGCGLRYDTNEIFYTLNGTYLGVAFENVSGKLYPTVGIDAKVKLSFNFGTESFQFSLHHLVKYF